MPARRGHHRPAVMLQPADIEIPAGWGEVGYFVLALAVGRVVLSLLPPGEAGSHRPRDLPLTLATCLLLGGLAVTLTARGLAACGLENEYVVFGAWLAIGAARWWLGPHAFVPRREREGEFVRGSLLVAAGLLVTCAWPIVEARAVDAARVREFVARAVLALFVLHGLASARRALIGRGLVVALLLTTPVLLHAGDEGAPFGIAGPLIAMGWIAMGCSFSIGWLRNADRRARALALIAFAASTFHSPVLWVAGFAALIGVTHANARKSTALAALAALLVIAVPLRISEGAWFLIPSVGAEGAPLAEVLRDTDRFGALVMLGVAALAAGFAGIRGAQFRPPPAGPGQIEAPRRELLGALAFVAAAAVVQFAQALFVPESMHIEPHAALTLMLPAIALVIGLVALRAERTPAAR